MVKNLNKALLVIATGLASAGCSPVIKAIRVKGWPLKSASAEITCEGSQPIKAKLDNGVTYGLNGTTTAREGLEPLYWNSGQFLLNPDPKLKALGMEFALLDRFNTAAEKACN